MLVETTADLAFALILAASRRVVEADRYVHEGRWRDLTSDLVGQDVHGTTLGIVGYGAIGRAVARRCHGFDMTVIHHSRTRRDDELSHWAPLDELLRSADIVSVHTPLTVETRGLIGERELRLMKPSAVLVNTSRGPLVDQVALTAALAQGRIFAAGLDVAAIEPILPDEPLLRLLNCICCRTSGRRHWRRAPRWSNSPSTTSWRASPGTVCHAVRTRRCTEQPQRERRRPRVRVAGWCIS